MKWLNGLVAGMFVLITVFPSFAQNSVVVIPMFGDDARPLKNIITVSAQNGDFTNPVDAMASITDASASNPYLIVIGPDEYHLDSPLSIKSFVSVTGSGRAATKLTGAISTTSGSGTNSLVYLGSDTSLTDLSVENTGGSTHSAGISINGGRSHLERVTVNATGGSNNIAIIVLSNGLSLRERPVFEDIVAYATGGTSSTGMFFWTGAVTMVHDSWAIARDGTSFNEGIHIDVNAAPVFRNVAGLASGGTNSYGAYNQDSTAAGKFRFSYLQGTTGAINFNESQSTVIQYTILDGQVLNDHAATQQCAHATDDSLHDEDC
jgi:hypothetical protein